ncbi:glycoside hydrolase family 16 protein [Sporosarcina trichiuri]|uniref:glycoside hydrolase family 16 protein n=1 Tax=Sporosarcina trichiuri TaxID=3056445 RepID=UPI0025B47644|nr:glycoside hydrolase family 16 protein [Sporosarcina sp. 0.2-SM1T-5]WJY28075.1 glycoside hydrolase family 16 protein [Sporosarcina sp. 0.2-SM1T-5]
METGTGSVLIFSASAIILLILISMAVLGVFRELSSTEDPGTSDILPEFTSTKSIDEGTVCMDKQVQPESSHRLSPAAGPRWELVWSDEFNGHCLDPDKWTPEDWAAEKNNELQYYTAANAEVQDGQLILTSRKEPFGGRRYTSGAVHTRGNFSFLYGKAEMRAKLPAGQGVFPAFWMMTDKEETWLPEIDIMEMLGHRSDEIWMVSHWLTEENELTSASQTFTGTDFSKDYHVFSLEWTPESLVWRIDGEERFKVTSPIPHEPMYLYLNTAIGGNWPGSPDETTRFPVTFEIDYVHVYQIAQ